MKSSKLLWGGNIVTHEHVMYSINILCFKAKIIIPDLESSNDFPSYSWWSYTSTAPYVFMA
jgi:hypothetical protein